MRGSRRAGLTAAGAVVAALVAGCASGTATPQAAPAATAATTRAARRAYDGAPPTVPHADPGAACTACHDGDGQSVGEAYAPPSPHAGTADEGATQRCRQCHVFVTTDGLFVASDYIGLPQNMRRGGRAGPGAPPTIPHGLRMRDNCLACHAGPAARAAVRTSHPERARCRQCHVPVTDRGGFPSDAGGLEEKG